MYSRPLDTPTSEELLGDVPEIDRTDGLLGAETALAKWGWRAGSIDNGRRSCGAHGMRQFPECPT